MLALVALGLLLRATPQGTRESAERNVSLVLAKEASTTGETEYFDESREVSEQEVSERAESASDSALDALPAAGELTELAIPQLQLPGPAAPLGADTDGLVQTPRLQVSGRRGGFSAPIDQEALERERARLRGRRPAGPAAKVSLFGSAPAVGHRFVFVIDRSQSMGGAGLGVLVEAEKELNRALAGLEPIHQFQIIAYHHKPTYFSDEGLVAATAENRRRVAKFFGGLAAFGATRHDIALLAALRAEPDCIFLLTDGGDPTPDQVTLHRIRQRAGGRTTIHCLQFGFEAPPGEENFMHRLAADTGGGYGYIQVGARDARQGP